jgi:hypothetical protein
LPHLVREGEEAGLVSAFAHAEGHVAALSQWIRRLGLGAEVVSIVASLSADNRPTIRLPMTEAGASRLVRLLVGGLTRA